MSPSIRPAVSADAASIASLGAATFEASFGHSMPADHMAKYLSESYSATTIASEIKSQGHHFYVAMDEDSDKVIGFVQLRTDTTEPCIPTSVPAVEVQRVYVHKDHLGSGAGGALMGKAMEWAIAELEMQGGGKQVVDGAAKGRGNGIVWLGVWEENVKAHRFYQRWGLEKVGEHDFVMSETRQTDWILMKWV